MEGMAYPYVTLNLKSWRYAGNDEKYTRSIKDERNVTKPSSLHSGGDLISMYGCHAIWILP